MGTHRLYEVRCCQRVETPEEYERVKVIALNLFHPTASPSVESGCFFHAMTQHLEGKGEGEGAVKKIKGRWEDE